MLNIKLIKAEDSEETRLHTTCGSSRGSTAFHQRFWALKNTFL